jgi:hypothetical protein
MSNIENNPVAPLNNEDLNLLEYLLRKNANKQTRFVFSKEAKLLAKLESAVETAKEEPDFESTCYIKSAGWD